MQAAAIAEALNNLDLEINHDLKYDLTKHKNNIALYESFIESKAAQFAGIRNMSIKEDDE